MDNVMKKGKEKMLQTEKNKEKDIGFVLPSEIVISHIACLLQDNDPCLQLAALKILTEIAAMWAEKMSEFASAVSLIAQILENKSKTEEIRAQAARVLAHLFPYATAETIKAMAAYTQELRDRWQQVSHGRELSCEIKEKANILST